MKYPRSSLFIGIVISLAFAVLPLVPASAQTLPVDVLGNKAPEDWLRHLEAAIEWTRQFEQGMQTLLTLNQSLQYQVRAFEALEAGSWDGFVEFFSYQAASMNGFNETVANLNDIPGIFGNDEAFSGASYERLKTFSNNMARSMTAANTMVASTDSLIKASEYNFDRVQRGLNEVANAGNVMQGLQGQAMILSAIASENRAVTQLLYTQQRYLQTLIENSNDWKAVNEAIASQLMAAPSDNDPDNPYRRSESSDYIRDSIRGVHIEGAREMQW